MREKTIRELLSDRVVSKLSSGVVFLLFLLSLAVAEYGLPTGSFGVSPTDDTLVTAVFLGLALSVALELAQFVTERGTTAATRAASVLRALYRSLVGVRQHTVPTPRRGLVGREVDLFETASHEQINPGMIKSDTDRSGTPAFSPPSGTRALSPPLTGTYSSQRGSDSSQRGSDTSEPRQRSDRRR